MIFIPTKNRPDNCPFLKMLIGTEVIAVVEPQDFDKYHNRYPQVNYIILPENNKGITYVRNHIKQYTEDNGIDYFWMADDDINGLFTREGTKLIRGDIDILNKAEIQFKKHLNVGMASLEYRQFAWSASKDEVMDSFCDAIVFINNKLTKGLRYREYVEGKEDRDFCMQVIKSGKNTLRTTLYAFSAPANGTNKGGLKEIFYDLGKERICAERMVELWGHELCNKIIKDDGRHDVKIYWDKINSNQLQLF